MLMVDTDLGTGCERRSHAAPKVEVGGLSWAAEKHYVVLVRDDDENRDLISFRLTLMTASGGKSDLSVVI